MKKSELPQWQPFLALNYQYWLGLVEANQCGNKALANHYLNMMCVLENVVEGNVEITSNSTWFNNYNIY